MKIVWSDLADEAFQRHFKLAISYHSPALEPEHLLIALTELKAGAASDLFINAGVLPSEVAKLAEAALPRGKTIAPLNVGTPSERWKSFFNVLYIPNMSTVGTGDVLIGLISFWESSDPQCALLAYFKRKGLGIDIIRATAQSAVESIARDLHDYDTSKMKVLQDRRWSRSYEIKPKHSLLESKFSTSEASITLAEIRAFWPDWDLSERLDFLTAYSSSPTLAARDEDQQIMEFLIGASTEEEWSTLAWLLGHHYKNRAKVFETLVRWLSVDGALSRANIVQSLAMFDEAAIPVIRESVERWLSKLDLDHFPEKPSWQETAPYSDCATCVGMLYKMTEDAKYKSILERFARYPDDLIQKNVVRDLADVSSRR